MKEITLDLNHYFTFYCIHNKCLEYLGYINLIQSTIQNLNINSCKKSYGHFFLISETLHFLKWYGPQWHIQWVYKAALSLIHSQFRLWFKLILVEKNNIMQLFSANTTMFLIYIHIYKFFFDHKKLKKTPSEILKFFSLIATQTSQTEEFVF